jgi:hypothetical protein
MDARRDMIDPELEAMMMRASFDALSAEEQKVVLASLGSAELYARMRAALVGARSVLASEGAPVTPRPATRDALHAAMKARHQGAKPARFRFAGVLALRVPLYQPLAALALAAVIMLVYLGGRQSGVRERIVYLQSPAAPAVQVDTDAIVERVVDSLKGEFARAADSDSRATDVAAGGARGHAGRSKMIQKIADTMIRLARQAPPPPAVQSNRFVGLGNLPGLDRQRRGKSVVEDSTLGRFRSRLVSDRI